MRKHTSKLYGIVLLVVLAACLAGCGGIKSGTVVNKEIIPDHYATGWHDVQTGTSCTMRTRSSYGSSSSMSYMDCSPTYTLMPYQYYVPTQYLLHLQACKVNKKGENKCRTGTAYVDPSVYRISEVGSWYGRKQGDNQALPSVPVDTAN